LAIVKLEADYKDLVAADNQEAVFTKVRLDKKEWDKVLAENIKVSTG
jgi:hypothetical protein